VNTVAVVAFDSLGTLFGLDGLEERMSRLLHHALSLTVAGAWAPLDGLAAALDPELGKRLPGLAAYDDALPALESVRRANGEAWVLTNGSRATTKGLLERSGLADLVTEIRSVEEVERYKPHPAVYELLPTDATLVAAHAWDVFGARATGRRAVWIDRLEQQWPLPGDPPGLRAPNLVEAARLANGT
jgi:2-haloacid dehalogenase